MMEKPVMKKKVGVSGFYPERGVISFYADKSMLPLVEGFGSVSAMEGFPHWYAFFVDARFDFSEVLAYIESLNGDGGEDEEEESE